MQGRRLQGATARDLPLACYCSGPLSFRGARLSVRQATRFYAETTLARPIRRGALHPPQAVLSGRFFLTGIFTFAYSLRPVSQGLNMGPGGERHGG